MKIKYLALIAVLIFLVLALSTFALKNYEQIGVLLVTSKDQIHNLSNGFTYTLGGLTHDEEEKIRKEPTIKIITSNNSIQFIAKFLDGGGQADSISLYKNGNTYTILLSDTDNKLTEMMVGYKLEGTIRNVKPGKYILQIASTSRTILESAFEVTAPRP